MPIWTNGQSTVVATSWGIARSAKDTHEIYRFPRANLRKDEEPPAMVFFVPLDEDGRRAIFRREGENAHLWTHTEGGMSVVPLSGVRLFDAVRCAEGLLALVVEARDGRERFDLKYASVDQDRASLDVGASLELPHGQRMTWPTSLWPTGEEPWSDDDTLGTRGGEESLAGKVRLTANRCGIALASSVSGDVASLGLSGELRWTAKLPAEPGYFDIHALPLPDGKLLVAYAATYGQNEYLLLEGGQPPLAHKSELGSQQAWGAPSAGLLWSDETVLVSSREAVWALELPKLAEHKFADQGALVDFGSTRDGKRHVVAFASAKNPQPHDWKLVGYDLAETKQQVRDIPLPDFRPAKPSSSGEDPTRAKGPVLLSAAAVENTWQVPLGETADVEIIVSNRGGPVDQGFYVHVGGIAKKNGLVELVGASISMQDEGSADLVKNERTSRIDFPGASLHPGFVIEKPTKRTAKAPPPPEQPSLTVTITLRGKKEGRGLLTVRVGPLGREGHRGSALIGRNLSVE